MARKLGVVFALGMLTLGTVAWARNHYVWAECKDWSHKTAWKGPAYTGSGADAKADADVAAHNKETGHAAFRQGEWRD